MATEIINAPEVVESQTTPEVIHPEKMNEKQRDRWLLTGEHPEVKEIKPKVAASAPAPASKEVPASQTGGEEQPRQASKKAADRVQELLQERHELREKLKKLEAAPKAESQPAAAKPTVQANEPAPPEKPKHPDLLQFKTTAEYELAMERYDQAMEAYSAKKAAFETAKKQSEENQAKLEAGLKVSWERVQTKYPDAKDKSAPIIIALIENQAAMPQVTWFLNNTEILPDLLYAMGGQFKVDEFIELGRTNPAKAIRVLAMMEKDILDELAKPVKAEEEKPEPVEEIVPREPKKVSQAPAPPREVGGQASAVEDPIKSAVARRDFGSFRETANQRDFQRKSRGR